MTRYRPEKRLKKIIQVPIHESYYQLIKKMDVDAAHIGTRLLEWWIEDYDKNVGKLLQIGDLESKIKALEIEIATLDEKKEMLVDLQHELKVAKSEYRESGNKILLAENLAVLNKKIILYHYNKDEIETKQSDVISNILELDPDFNLDLQIRKVKMLHDQLVV